MFHLIVTNDEELIEKARECGAGVFTAEKLPEDIIHMESISGKSTSVYEILRSLDVKPNIKGYQYLEYLMERCKEDPSYHKRPITKVIGPDCAKQFGTTAVRVERAVRHALEGSFSKVPDKYSEIFGGTFTKVPTNSEFISLVSEYFAKHK